MYKVTLNKFWNKKGTPTPYVKYLKVDEIKDVFKFYTTDEVLEIEEC
jgi:hypothetical protein